MLRNEDFEKADIRQGRFPGAAEDREELIKLCHLAVNNGYQGPLRALNNLQDHAMYFQGQVGIQRDATLRYKEEVDELKAEIWRLKHG
jgi:hypothetical protein